MTDYIEEMMRTTGIKPKYKYLIKGNTVSLTVDKDWIIRHFKDRKFQSVYKIIKVEKYYPDFTAEKQLEIIKLIIHNVDTDEFYINFFPLSDTYLLSVINHPHSNKSSSGSTSNKVFELALARLTTKLMNKGELDKQKVKEILENESSLV